LGSIQKELPHSNRSEALVKIHRESCLQKDRERETEREREREREIERGADGERTSYVCTDAEAKDVDMCCHRYSN